MARFVIIGQHALRGNTGGMEVYNASLASSLRALGHQVVQIGWGAAHSPTFISITPYQKGRYFTLALRHLPPIPKDAVVITDRPDRAALLRHLPNDIICVLHGSHARNVRAKKGPLVHWFYRRLERQGLRRADRVISVSQETADAYAARYPFLPSKLVVIPVGVSSDFKPLGKAAARKAWKIPAKTPVALYVGRLEKEKRVDRIISALSGTPTLLLIAGEGSLRSRLERGSSSVRFLGSVPHQKLSSLMSAADVLVLASEHEGLPTVALEAMACGTPVVSTPVGDLPRLIENGANGYLTAVTGMGPMIEKAVGDASLRKGALATATAYRWDTITDRIVEACP